MKIFKQYRKADVNDAYKSAYSSFRKSSQEITSPQGNISSEQTFSLKDFITQDDEIYKDQIFELTTRG